MDRLEQLLKLVSAAPDDPFTHYAVALEYVSQERFDDAVAAFARVLALDGDYSPAYYHKARAEIRADRREAARQTLDAGMRCAHKLGDAKTEREMKDLLDTTG